MRELLLTGTCVHCGRVRPRAALQRAVSASKFAALGSASEMYTNDEKMCRGRKACDAERVHAALLAALHKALSSETAP